MSTPNATVTRENVLAGPAAMYVGTLNASGAVVGAPAASAVNTAPAASAWRDVGGTSGGLQVITNQSFFTMRVDQIPDSLGRRLIERDVLLRTSMAEGTLLNLMLAMNVDPDELDSGTGYQQYELPFGQPAMFPHEVPILCDGWAPVAANAARRRRVIGRRCVSIENIEKGYVKDGLFLIPVTFGCMYVDSATSPVVYTDETA